ncbi:MAG: carbohydrate binding domain-containing protein [Bacteroidia bacterium]
MALGLSTSAYQCSKAAEVSISTTGSNMQLYQRNISLQPNTQYTLSFAAKSNTGHDLRAYLHEHTSGSTNYGISGQTFNLTSSGSFSPIASPHRPMPIPVMRACALVSGQCHQWRHVLD